MRLRQRHSKQVTATLRKIAAVFRLMAFVGGVAGDTSANTPEAVAVTSSYKAVTSPSEFQDAVRSGVKHIIINEHLDMTTTLRFSETTIADTVVIAIAPNDDGYTSTIRVRGHYSTQHYGCKYCDLHTASGELLAASGGLPGRRVPRITSAAASGRGDCGLRAMVAVLLGIPRFSSWLECAGASSNYTVRLCLICTWCCGSLTEARGSYEA